MTDPKKRTITVITVGSKDYEPTSEDLQAVVETFQTAQRASGSGILALSFPYSARVLDVTASEGIMASTGWLSDTDIKLCVEAFQRAQYGLTAYTDSRDAAGVAAFRAELDKRMAGD